MRALRVTLPGIDRAALRNARRGLAATLAAIAVGLGATGCWNAIPIGHRALIQILSVDPAPGANLRWTFFQANPTALAQMGSGGGAASPGGGTTADQVVPIAVEAPSLGDAFRRAQDLTSRDLYLGQMQQIVLSERLTPRAVRMAIDALAHTPELDQSQAVFAAAGGAAATILQPDPQELFPATYLEHVTACPTCNNVSTHVSLMAAFLDTRTAWGSMLVPEVGTGPLGLTVRGLALYEGSRFVARVNPDDATLLGLLTGGTTKTSLQVAVPGLGLASVRSLRGHARIRARWLGGRAIAQAETRITGQVMGIEPERGLTLEAIAPRVDTAVSAAIVARTGTLVAALLGQGGDPLEFGRELWSADPSAAPSPGAWREGLMRARVRLTVHVALASQGAVR